MKIVKIVMVLTITMLFALLYYETKEYCNKQNELISLKKNKKEYEKLTKEIKEYTEIKNNYDIVIKEESNLNSIKNNLQNKINSINGETVSLEEKIKDINQKISKIS